MSKSRIISYLALAAGYIVAMQVLYAIRDALP